MQYIGSCIIKNGVIESLEDQEPIGADMEVYEVIRVEGGCPLFLEDHMDRWRTSMEATKHPLPQWASKFENLISWLIVCNGITDCDLRIASGANDTIQCGFIETHYPTPDMYAEGVECQILRAEREDPRLKIYHHQMREDAAKQQTTTKAYESLLVNRNGEVTEGSRSNVYFVSNDGIIRTAPDNMVLGGIMRKKVTALCQTLGIELEYKAVKESEIGQYSVAFLSSTPMRILPIRQIGSVVYNKQGEGAAQEVLRRLMSEMERVVANQKNGCKK